MEDMSIGPKTSKVINICGSIFWILQILKYVFKHC
jgi:hypothetical protein